MILSWHAVILLAVAFCCVAVIQHIWHVRKFPSAPGPTAGIFSRMWYIWAIRKGDFHEWNIRQHALHGKVVRVGPNMYSIDDVDAMKTIYGIGSNMPKSDWYTVWATPGIPDHNLFSALNRQVHARMRRRVASWYSMTAVKSYEPYVDNCVSILLRHFDQMASRAETFDLQRWMQSYAFDVIGEITFSSRIGFMESGGQDIDGIIHYLDVGNEFGTVAGVNQWLLPFWLAYFGNPNRGLRQYTAKLTLDRGNKGVAKDGRPADDFYTKVELLREKDPEAVSVDRADNVLAMNVAAGSDTTSISLTAAMFYLLSNPAAMSKLRTEILRASDNGRVSTPITFEEAQQLPYLQAVIKESMRLHPATGLPLWRVVQEPGEKISGTFFPAGSIVGINTWVAHRNKDVFGSDAHIFRPERWDPAMTPAEQLARMEHYFLPFGAGTRTCIGKNISHLEMCKAVPELVRRYDFQLVSPEVRAVNHWFVKQRDVMVQARHVGDTAQQPSL